jgi:hypothetical protein
LNEQPPLQYMEGSQEIRCGGNPVTQRAASQANSMMFVARGSDSYFLILERVDGSIDDRTGGGL